MIIRNTVKVIICENNKILLNKSKRENGTIFYDIPGGGQNAEETIVECALRECLEETGYVVELGNLIAIGEEFDYTLPKENKFYHRIIYFYRGEKIQKKSLEKQIDKFQIESCWIDINEIDNIDIEPRVIKDKIKKVINSNKFVDLGCNYKGLN